MTVLMRLALLLLLLFGGPALIANVYLEGAYSERYPEVTEDLAGEAGVPALRIASARLVTLVPVCRVFPAIAVEITPQPPNAGWSGLPDPLDRVDAEADARDPQAAVLTIAG